MLKIYPEIEFDAKCPIDNSTLDIKDIVIPGMRCLADASCPTCGSRYYVDLPVSHGLWTSIALNQKTAKIYDSLNVEWFSNLLKKSFLDPVKTNTLPIVHKFLERDRIVIVNCLDFLYGHSLLKLLNVQRYLEHYPDLGCCVLVPTQLLHLVPDGVAEIWEFPVSIKDGWKWHSSLQTWITQQITKRKECFLSKAYSHPSNRVYDLRRFVKDLPNVSKDIEKYEPIILFSYREDRLWGNNLAHQQHNLQKLYKQLGSIFPNFAFVVVGFGHKNQIRAGNTKLIDLRTNKFDLECDRLWMSYMSAADCAIGVHGSNMLMPSGLAKSTVELVARPHISNLYQDILFPSALFDIRDAFLKYRFMYGKDNCSDIDASLVSEVIISILADNERNSFWFKQGESDNDVFIPSKLLVSELATQHFNSFSLYAGLPEKLKKKTKAFLKNKLHLLG